MRHLTALALACALVCALAAAAPVLRDNQPHGIDADDHAALHAAFSALAPLYVPMWSRESAVGKFGGGSNCAACQIVITLLQQYANIHEENIGDVVNKVCTWLPVQLQSPCNALVKKFGPAVINLLEQKESPLMVCNQINICTTMQCELHAIIPPALEEFERHFSHKHAMKVYERIMEKDRLERGTSSVVFSSPLTTTVPHDVASRLSDLAPIGDSIWDKFMAELNKALKSHLPTLDADGDHFSGMLETLRGFDWRGRDCNDLDRTIYPGRNSSTHPPEVDANCNGIKGRAPNGQSYEDMLCAGTGARGTIVLGDSASAHFHIPPQYMHAASLEPSIFTHVLHFLENEIDWPESSGYTGFTNRTWGLEPGATDSIYTRMRDRNLCNHRDYQNIAVNGARVDDIANEIVFTMNRDQQNDRPALVFHPLIGNDLCRGRLQPDGSMGGYTTPDEFEAAVLKTLNYLDTKLPAGSAVVFVGLADGRVLYDNMHDVLHPIGATYMDVYELLLCLETSPCFGWLNPNEAYRNATSEWGFKLSAVYEKIIAEHSFKNFKMAYYSFVDMFNEALEEWTSHGGTVPQLIEPVDGFHPSQIGLSLIARAIFQHLEQEHPDFLGAPNPNNGLIMQLFGDQGGY